MLYQNIVFIQYNFFFFFLAFLQKYQIFEKNKNKTLENYFLNNSISYNKIRKII